MRIVIFYRDVFERGGEPGDMRHFAAALAAEHEVFLWGKSHGDSAFQPRNVICRTYESVGKLFCKISPWMEEVKPDVILVAGFFLYENLLVALSARRRSRFVVLLPLSHVWEEIFKGKMFTASPHVRDLEVRRLNIDSTRDGLATAMSPWIKKAYKYSVGKMLVRSSDRIAAHSADERREFQRYYPRADADMLELHKGINEMGEQADGRHFYRDVLGHKDEIANMVFWGRLDWKSKGIDRMMEAMREIRDRFLGSVAPLRLFLAGPDYRGGSAMAETFIKKHRLDDLVHLLPPGAYPPGSMTPLRDADASVILSRWGPFPRVSREASYYGVPLIVSRETCLGAVVSRCSAGVAVEDADDPVPVADGMLALAEPGDRARWKSGANSLAGYLDWGAVAKRFATDLERALKAGPSVEARRLEEKIRPTF